jgi:hypothetical protein
MCFICVSHLKEFPTISPFSPYNVISQTIKIKKKKTEHYNCKKRRGVNWENGLDMEAPPRNGSQVARKVINFLAFVCQLLNQQWEYKNI